MTVPAPPLFDGVVVGFLLRVLDRFERAVSSPSALLASLKGVGLDDAALTHYQSFLSARASDPRKALDRPAQAARRARRATTPTCSR